MSEAPSLIASALAMAGSIAVAAINRGAAASVAAVRAEVEKNITGPDGRLTKLEAKVAELGGWPAAFQALEKRLVLHINNELAAAKGVVSRAASDVRRQTGSFPSVQTNEELAREIGRHLGIEEMRGRLTRLEESDKDKAAAAVELTREIGRLTGHIEAQEARR